MDKTDMTQKEKIIKELITSLQYGIDRDGTVDETVWRNQLSSAIDRIRREARKEALRETIDSITNTMRDFSNTPLSERKNGWDWLVTARDRIEDIRKEAEDKI